LRKTIVVPTNWLTWCRLKTAPVHFIVGSQALQQRLFVDDVRKSLFPSGSGGLNDDTFDVKEKSLTEIFDLANTFPMLAAKRLVVVRNVDDPKEADEARWLAYLENPPARRSDWDCSQVGQTESVSIRRSKKQELWPTFPTRNQKTFRFGSIASPSTRGHVLGPGQADPSRSDWNRSGSAGTRD